MTRADAIAAATVLADRLNKSIEVWEHIGGRTPAGTILPQGRFIVHHPTDPPPRYVWALRLLVSRAGNVTEVAA